MALISLRVKVNVLAMGYASLQDLFTTLLLDLPNFTSLHSPTFSLYSSRMASLLFQGQVMLHPSLGLFLAFLFLENKSFRYPNS